MHARHRRASTTENGQAIAIGVLFVALTVLLLLLLSLLNCYEAFAYHRMLLCKVAFLQIGFGHTGT